MFAQFNRRSFLVMIGTAVIGKFVIPDLPGEEESTSDAENQEAERIRNVLVPPTWDDDHTVMVWVEQHTDGESVVMMWNPVTVEEREEAERFCNDAKWPDDEE